MKHRAKKAIDKDTTDNNKEFSVSTAKALTVQLSPWLHVTSIKTGYTVLIPLPIRLIQQIPDTAGGGCIIRGAHGDETTAKENVCEILDILKGYPLGKGLSVWSLAK